RPVAGGNHRVFILDRATAAEHGQGPAVVLGVDPFRSGRQERLDGEHRALLHHPSVVLVVPGGDFLGLLVERTADSVTGEIANQLVAALVGEFLDALADLVERPAGADRGYAGPHGAPAVAAQGLDGGF